MFVRYLALLAISLGATSSVSAAIFKGGEGEGENVWCRASSWVPPQLPTGTDTAEIESSVIVANGSCTPQAGTLNAANTEQFIVQRNNGLTIKTEGTINNLQLGGEIIATDGAIVRLTGESGWGGSSRSFSGAGKFMNASNMIVDGSSTAFLRSTLVNTNMGTMTWQGENAIAPDGVLQNHGTIELLDASRLSSGGVLENSGQVIVRTGTDDRSIVRIEPKFVQQGGGKLQILEGTASLRREAEFQGGTIEVSENATLSFFQQLIPAISTCWRRGSGFGFRPD